MPRRKHIIRYFVLLGLFALALALFGSYRTTRYTCLECRATLEKRWLCGIPLHSVAQSPYSRTFSKHEHSRRWCGAERSDSLLGVSRACGRQHSIWRLPVTVQADYARLVSSTELHEALQVIDSDDLEAAAIAIERANETVMDSRAPDRD